MGELDGQTALVTGAARGLGRGMAERLAAGGAVVGILDAQPATDTVAAIEAAGGRAFAIEATIGAPGATETFLAGLDAGLAGAGASRLDILVNNIGGGKFETFETTTLEDLTNAFFLNACVPFLVTQAVASRLSDGGRVINISSLAGRAAPTDTMSYAMAKAAVDNFTRSLAKVLGPRLITVNAIAPGLNEGETQDEHFTPELIQQSVQATLFARSGRREDIADAVYMLATPAGHWVTGQIIEATGGIAL